MLKKKYLRIGVYIYLLFIINIFAPKISTYTEEALIRHDKKVFMFCDFKALYPKLCIILDDDKYLFRSNLVCIRPLSIDLFIMAPSDPI